MRHPIGFPQNDLKSDWSDCCLASRGPVTFGVFFLFALVVPPAGCTFLVDFPDRGSNGGQDGAVDADTDAGGDCVPESTEPCYSGAPGTDVGECHAGTRTCDGQGRWGPCDGEVTPEMQCTGRECGPDGCNDTCGECEDNIPCDEGIGRCQRPMVRILSGTYSMGSPPGEQDRSDDETAHNVTLDTFLIDRTEVTNQAYKVCVDASVCDVPDSCDSGQPVWVGPDYPQPMAHHPVVCVTWEMAKTYCEWDQKRLCTEAEWERACVYAAAHRVFPWGDQWPASPFNYANCHATWCLDQWDFTAPVASFPDGSTVDGFIDDMAGNVSEWVLDWYDETTYNAGDQTNPQGPCDGADPCTGRVARVHRGGSYATYREFLRCSRRASRLPSSREPNIGFRCCNDNT